MGRSPVEGEVDGGAVAVFEDLDGFLTFCSRVLTFYLGVHNQKHS